MTKINKLGKSTFVIAILSFLLVAVLAFGGTYAYFSAVSGRAAGQVKTGHLYLDATGDAIDIINGYTIASNTIVQPGQRLVGAGTYDEDADKWTLDEDGEAAAVTAEVASNIKYYIRVRFDVDVTVAQIENERGEMVDREHNGVMTHDNLLTPADEEVIETLGKGDYVADDLQILAISLKVDGAEWKELILEETGVDPDGEGPEAAPVTRTHTGYYYPTYGIQDAVDHTYNMEVLINIADWVGAYGCTYYMDAGIEVHFQVEVLQADYLDKAEYVGAPIADNASLHAAWDLAVKHSQPQG